MSMQNFKSYGLIERCFIMYLVEVFLQDSVSTE